MDTATKSPLASRIGALVETGIDFSSAPDEARSTLHSLRQEYPELRKFLEHRFARLSEAQQQVVLALLEAAPAPDLAPLLQQWSRSAALPLPTRARAIEVQEHGNGSVDPAYRDGLVQAARLLHQLHTAEPSPLDENDALAAPWSEELAQLPLDLRLDVARELGVEHADVTLAVLRAIRPAASGHDALTFVEALADIPLTGSALLLQELLGEATDKGLQKAIKKALHRLKVQGVTFADVQPKRHTVVVGAVAHRLEKCLASFIDGAGERMFLLIRTKPMGGYNIAYLVINYGTGIRYALGLQASKRELPEILEKVQGPAPLIDLEPSYCQYQIALAQQMNLETNTPVPEEYFALRDIIGECNTTFERAIIYSALSDADLEAAKTYDTYADELLKLPEFAGWTLPESIIQKYGDALREIEQSQIVVSPSLKQERIDEIQARAMEEVLGERSRRLMRMRLEEMAYYLLRTDRRREALWAVAAAQSLEDDNPHRLRRNPFAGALLERSLEQAKARPSSGRIILPFSHLPGGGGGGGGEPRLIVP
jgi:flavin-binding protein dodecin